MAKYCDPTNAKEALKLKCAMVRRRVSNDGQSIYVEVHTPSGERGEHAYFTISLVEAKALAKFLTKENSS